MFIRIAGDPALTAEVLARFALQGHALAVRGLIDRIHTLDPVADPARANLQYNDAQLREEVEDAILKERGKTGTNRIAQDHILIEGGVAPGHAAKACRRRPMRLESRVEPTREPEFLGRGEDAMVVGVPVGLAAPDERRDKEAAHPITRRAA